MSGHPQEALGWADKALALADELGGLPEERLRALDARGVARGDLGDLGGMEDLRAALAVGLEIGAGYDTAVVYNNLIEPLWLSEGPAASALVEEVLGVVGDRGGGGWYLAQHVADLGAGRCLLASAGRRTGTGSRPPAACWRRSRLVRSWPRPTRPLRGAPPYARTSGSASFRRRPARPRSGRTADAADA